MDIKHRSIVFDAADIETESAFWAGLLDGTVEKWSARWHAIFVDGEWALAVQLSPDHVPPVWPDGAPQQMHLDFYFEGIEAHDAASDEVLGLGGRRLKYAADRTAPRGVDVFADPAGHPFCLCWVPAPS
jgi:catechol 2,3-dioxygenase-like lactoylglutathione lyase family enzyme